MSSNTPLRCCLSLTTHVTLGNLNVQNSETEEMHCGKTGISFMVSAHVLINAHPVMFSVQKLESFEAAKCHFGSLLVTLLNV